MRAFYFKGEFDVSPLADMSVGRMPHLLELVTRTERFFVTDDDGRWTERDFEAIEEEDSLWECKRAVAGRPVTVMEGDLGSVYRLVRNYGRIPELFNQVNAETRLASLEEENARQAAEIEDLRSQIARPQKRRG